MLVLEVSNKTTVHFLYQHYNNSLYIININNLFRLLQNDEMYTIYNIYLISSCSGGGISS